MVVSFYWIPRFLSATGCCGFGFGYGSRKNHSWSGQLRIQTEFEVKLLKKTAKFGNFSRKMLKNILEKINVGPETGSRSGTRSWYGSCTKWKIGSGSETKIIPDHQHCCRLVFTLAPLHFFAVWFGLFIFWMKEPSTQNVLPVLYPVKALMDNRLHFTKKE